VPGGPQPGLDQEGDSGLAAGSRDPQDGQAGGWVAVDPAASAPSSALGPRSPAWDPGRGHRRAGGAGRIGEQRDGARRQRLADEVGTVRRDPGNAAKRSPGRTSCARRVTPVTVVLAWAVFGVASVCVASVCVASVAGHRAPAHRPTRPARAARWALSGWAEERPASGRDLVGEHVAEGYRRHDRAIARHRLPELGRARKRGRPRAAPPAGDPPGVITRSQPPYQPKPHPRRARQPFCYLTAPRAGPGHAHICVVCSSVTPDGKRARSGLAPSEHARGREPRRR